MPQSPTSSAPRPRARRAIRLERSPFEPAVMLRGAVVGLVLAGLFLAVGFPLTAASPLDADLRGLRRVNITDVDWLVTTARLVSQTGHLALVVVVAVLVALWARWRWRTWDLGLLLFVVLSGSQAVTAVVKLLTSRERPDDALVSTLSSAFPSGHAVRGAAVYGLVAWLVLLVVRRRVVRLAVAGFAVLAILGSALARVALVAHWPTDVVGGVVVGTVWLVASLQLVRPQLVRLPASEVSVADLEEVPAGTRGTGRTGSNGGDARSD
jgi:membrane-associated phospholipid phosphatase